MQTGAYCRLLEEIGSLGVKIDKLQTSLAGDLFGVSDEDILDMNLQLMSMGGYMAAMNRRLQRHS